MSRMLGVILLGFAFLLSSLAVAAVDMSKSRSDVASFAGSYSQSIPIAVAPGRAGMQPALSLNYSSSAGNGLYGMGWDLDLTRIERETKNGAPGYTDTDDYVLVMKGSRQALVNVQGSEYRIANESSFLKLTKSGNSWIVRDQNNIVYTLAAPWPTSGAKTFSWSLSGVTDVHGNTMTYAYADGGKGHRLQRVDYGLNYVELSYDFNRSDVITSYRSGQLQQTSARLQSIKSFVSNGAGSPSLASHVSFSYGNKIDQNDYRSLLTKATVHDITGQLAPQSITYSYTKKDNGSAVGAWPILPVVNSRINNGARGGARITGQSSVIDFDANGDGVIEKLSYAYRSRFGAGRTESITYPAGFSPSYLGIATPAHTAIVRTNASRGALTKSVNVAPTYYPHAIVDMHGDAYMDWVVKDATGNWRVYQNEGKALSATYTVWEDPAGTAGYRAFYDVNGDGLPDLLSTMVKPVITVNPYSGYRSCAMNWSVYLNMGTHFNAVPFTKYLPGFPIPVNNTLTDFGPNVLQGASWDSKSLMTSVTDESNGQLKEIEYVQTAGISGAPGLKLWTVSRVTNSAPGIAARSSSYAYSGGLYVASKKEFRGFATSVQTDDQTGMTTTTTYAQDIIFQGRPKSVVSSLNSVNLSESVTTWAAKSYNSGKRHFAYASQVDSTHWDLNGILLKQESTTSTYDNLGHLLSSSSITNGGFSSLINNTYSGTDTCASITTSVSKQRWVKNPIPASVLNSPSYIHFLGIVNGTVRLNGRLSMRRDAMNNAQAYISMINSYNWGGHWETYYVDITAPDEACWKVRKLVNATVTNSTLSDSQTRTSSFEYTAEGQLYKETIEPGSSLWQQTEYAYDAWGNNISTTVRGAGVAARTTSKTYDANHHYPVSTTNALGHTESYTWDARLGKKTSLTGPNGLTTAWVYDGFGRKVREDRADGGYSTVDLSNAPASVTTTASGSNPVTVYFDAMGRDVRKVTIGFDGAPIYSEVEYDSLGRKWKEYLPHTGTRGLFTEYAYDELSRPVRVTNPNGDFATTSYNGLTVTTTNPKGQGATTEKNVVGKVIKVTDAMNGVMSYAYDANGNLVATTDAAGNTTSMSYDIRGRKTGMVDPDMGVWSYQYDALGNLISQTDAKNQTTTMVYDALGRMTSRTEPEGTSTWTYDTLWIGALSSETGGIASKSYVYDTFGRVRTSNSTINGQFYSVSTTYDGLGRVDTITYPNGVAIKRNYNAFFHMASISNLTTGAMIWQANRVDEFGHLTSESFGNGVSSTHVYDNVRGVLTGLSSTSGGATIQNWSYDYDAVGNMQFRTDAVVGYSERFEYDDLNRLTAVRDAGSVLQKQYSYDAIGNITYKSDVGSYSYDPNHPHAVQSAGGNSYTYDANGNQISGAGRTLAWTSFNKAATIATAQGFSEFGYDAGHNRVWKRAPLAGGFETTHYIGKIFERRTLNGLTKDVANIYAGSKLVASIEDMNGIASTRYMHGDHLGSISVITDEVGAVVERLRFDAFGAPVDPNTGAAKANFGASNTTRGFTGHEMDASTGLINMNARLYDPVLGRFISADTVVPGAGNMQAFNRYAYVDNNPLKYTDPTGHWKLKNFIKSAGVFAKAAVFGMMGFKETRPYAIMIASAMVLGPAAAGMAGFAEGTTAFFMASGAFGGAIGTALSGGNSKEILYSAILGGVAGGIHGMDMNWVARAITHGVASAGVNTMFGMDAGAGFLSGLSGGLTGGMGADFGGDGLGGVFVRTAIAGTIGGVASKMAGGSFMQGFRTAAYMRLFNCEGDKITAGFSFLGFDFKSTIYDENLGPVPSTQIEKGVSTTLIGGGITYDRCVGNPVPSRATAANPPLNVDISIGLGKYLGFGWNDAQGIVRFSIGAAVAPPVSVGKSTGSFDGRLK